MEHLFESWERLEGEFRSRYTVLLLDCDGTLAPIAETPEAAAVPAETRRLLRRLARSHGCAVAVISGRALSDVRTLVGVTDLVYAGNHGLEIEGPGVRLRARVSKRQTMVLSHVDEEIRSRLAAVDGVLVEHKGFSLSVHYRLVARQQVSVVRRAVQEAAGPFLETAELVIAGGKKVFEVRLPIEWNKGNAALWLLGRYAELPGGGTQLAVYIGDDETDEDAFRALGTGGLTVRVGVRRGSRARYFLRDTDEVRDLLERILGAKREVEP